MNLQSDFCVYLPSLQVLREGTAAADSANIALLDGQTRLTVPIEGGRRAKKGLPPCQWRISEHGRWRHVHAGALEALYHRAPFWNHYAPALLGIIEDESEKSFAAMTARLTCRMLRDIRYDELRGRLLPTHTPQVVLCVSDEQVRGELSLLHYMLTWGPDTIFFLNPTLSLR